MSIGKIRYMKKQSNTPEIRFQNYEDKWDIEKLINIFGTIRNAFVGTATPYYVEKGHFYLESNNVKNGKINYNSQIFINDEFYEKQRDKWLKTNDIVMVQSGHVGHTAVIPEELNNTAAHALIVFTDYKKEVNPHFLNYQFQSNGKRKKLDLISTGNTIKHILASEMKDFKMDFPTFEEQSAIGSLFRTLDDLLSNYKENLANYQSLKATMLAKMFPKAGQTVPEIRLDGFEEEWGKDTLEPYLIESRISGDTGLTAKKITVKLWGKGVIEKEEKYAGSLNTQYFIRKGGQFIYSKLDFQNQAFGIIPNELDGYQSTLDLPTFDIQNIDSKFLLEYVMRREFYEYQGLIANGSRKAKRIHPEDFLVMPVRIPSIEEQQAIGSYFSNLDNLINSQQEKISQLETLKKKLLQDMFI
jgi:hypothetical protein